MATNVITGETGYIPVGFVKDVNEAASDVEVLAKYRKNLSRIEYVSSALDEFLSLKDSISEPTFNNQMALERKARSYFTEFSIFLDHWKNYAGHGEKKGEFKKLYEEKTHEAFDSSDYYALATMLRNYVIHDSDIVQGSFWGESIFDVGCSKTTLLNSKIFTKKKKQIIDRQPAEFISLTPIMCGALEVLKEIHKAFLDFSTKEEVAISAKRSAELINRIKEMGDDKHWYFRDEDGPYLMSADKDGQAIEVVKCQRLEYFPWKEYEEVISRIIQKTMT